MDFRKIEDMFLTGRNVAFVSSEDILPENFSNDHSLAYGVLKNSPEFQVLEFNANTIKMKTHFASRKFLVYNDNFHSGWQAIVNGQKVPILRSNIAFKGLWIPAGDSLIYFHYAPAWLYWINFGLLGTFYFIFLFLLGSWRRFSFNNRL